ncbi:DUF2975 domain-containing protein [Dongshaea marina]|uniref:DUF2975 domain-containing protein n=1 Tax=Dongshaea marina TaxID=2047966 RepID=UPI000D3E6471|nr:DUF2975 domain-containing protein [Dongshaea marina]
MSKLEVSARKFRILFQILFWVTPLVMMLFWGSYHTPLDYYSQFIPIDFSDVMLAPLTLGIRVLAFVVCLIPVAIIMFALHQLISLFRSYERGEVFSLTNANRYQKLGYSMFVWVIGGIVSSTLLTLVVSLNNPPGHRLLTLSLTGTDLINIVYGFLVLIIAHVMQRAHRINDENNLTI